MGNLPWYRTLIKERLAALAELINQQPRDGIDVQCAFDDDRGQYLLITVGWSGKQRVLGTTLHVRLKNNKIWIEEDWTEDGLATDLVRAGVPKEDIVLAFHPPQVRPATEFAVA